VLPSFVVQAPVLQSFVRGKECEEVIPALVRRQLTMLVLQDALQQPLIIALQPDHARPPTPHRPQRCWQAHPAMNSPRAGSKYAPRRAQHTALALGPGCAVDHSRPQPRRIQRRRGGRMHAVRSPRSLKGSGSAADASMGWTLRE
jgi:hypothetical protein